MDSSAEKLIEKIDLTGSWRVVVRPTVFEEERIPELSICEKLLQECCVSLRGWDYPQVSHDGRVLGQDFVEYSTDWFGYIEVCRLYQSGQFAHRFAMDEDYVRKAGGQSAKRRPKSEGRFLSPGSAVYTFTEIYEFAARLASKGILGSEVYIEISLHKLNERTLSDRNAHFSETYTCTVDDLAFKGVYSTTNLIGNSAELARKQYVKLFHRFGWTKLGPDAYIEDQKKLLEKRL